MKRKILENQINEYFQSYAKHWPLSGSFLIARGDQVIYEKAFGLANREHNVPNTPETRFLIGSITKSFTATAIMILKEQGLLTLEDSLTKYFPDYPEVGEKITIRHLLTHTSGIPTFTLLPGFSNKLERIAMTNEELLSLFKYRPLYFEPGTKAEYSNSNYYLLGMIIEKITTKSYSQFIQDAILNQLKMQDSGVYHQRFILPRKANGYEINGERWVNSAFVEMSTPFAAGAMYSTTRDLLKFIRGLNTGKLVSEDCLMEMFTPVHKIDGLIPYGYGFYLTKHLERERIGHDGGLHGFISQMYYYPDDKISIILLGNIVESIWRIGDDLATILFGESYQLPEKRLKISVIPTLYEMYAGEYEDPYNPASLITVIYEHGKMYIKIRDNDPFEVYPVEENLFTHCMVDEQYRFREKDGDLYLLGHRKKRNSDFYSKNEEDLLNRVSLL